MRLKRLVFLVICCYLIQQCESASCQESLSSSTEFLLDELKMAHLRLSAVAVSFKPSKSS